MTEPPMLDQTVHRWRRLVQLARWSPVGEAFSEAASSSKLAEVSWDTFQRSARRPPGSSDAPVTVSLKAREPIERVFQTLFDRWLEDTLSASSTHEIVLHPLHFQIIGLGEPGLPYLLRVLSDHPDRVLLALEAIARENPALEATSYDEAVEAWRGWGLEMGLAYR